jgi:DNA modification methylase
MPLSQLDPYWQTRDEATVRLYHGDAMEVLERMPSQSVHCAVTSPPYWGLRKYLTDDNRELGLESHPDLYVSRLVEVFREVRRVLRDDSTFWLDIGDTFGPKGDWKRSGMVGIPHRLAFALQDDGWILAMEHIHSKPAPMTESVTNRCTKSHEYIFMFVKKAGYFFDQFAIREKSNSFGRQHASDVKPPKVRAMQLLNYSTSSACQLSTNYERETRNKRSVWEVPHGGYKGAHFATFSGSLILPCIKAGTSEKGCCMECGAPWKRVVERTRTPTRPGENSKITDVNGARLNGEVIGNRDPERHVTSLRHLGWYPSCKCYGLPSMPSTPSAGESSYAEWVKQARELCRQAEEEHGDSVEPCVVLDPFIGSGTTAVVCLGLGRYSMGIDLSEDYLQKNAIPRIEGELLGRPALASLVPR